jgi:hypothetical protein
MDYLMTEAVPTSETLWHLTKNKTMENIERVNLSSILTEPCIRDYPEQVPAPPAFHETLTRPVPINFSLML